MVERSYFSTHVLEVWNPKTTNDTWNRKGRKRIHIHRLELRKSPNNELIISLLNFTHLLRTVAYCQRFIANAQLEHTKGNLKPLSPNELDIASRYLVHCSQQEMFPDGISKTKGIGPLNPFLDEQEFIRIGGRERRGYLWTTTFDDFSYGTSFDRTLNSMCSQANTIEAFNRWSETCGRNTGSLHKTSS